MSVVAGPGTKVIEGYLKELRREARVLPRGRRDELVGEVREHLETAVAPDGDETAARNAVEALGPASAIVAAEIGGEPSRGSGHAFEWIAIVLLLLGGFIFALGWVVGLVMLWSSSLWSTRQKLLGTFVVPGGLASLWIALIVAVQPVQQICESRGHGQVCHTTSSGSTAGEVAAIALVVFMIVGPIFTAIVLGRAVRRSPA